jgi:hypothetical protein
MTQHQNRGRLTFTMQLSHYHDTSQQPWCPQHVGFYKWIDSLHSVYERPMSVGADAWTPIDLGWIDKPGLLIIAVGVDPRRQGVDPDPEKSVLLGIEMDDGTVVPALTFLSGETYPVPAIDPTRVLLKAAGSSLVQCRVSVVPG